MYRFYQNDDLDNTQKDIYLSDAEKKLIQLVSIGSSSVVIDKRLRPSGLFEPLNLLIKSYGLTVIDSDVAGTSNINDEVVSEKVTVIITSYNYGHYLPEAIDSVLSQTYLPDEIILSDDASTDLTSEIMRYYQAIHPSLIRVNINKDNMGIEDHFNKVVKMAKGDYICILGADNRMPAHYIKEQFLALHSDKDVGIVYTDFALFGNRAKDIYNNFFADFRGRAVSNDTYTIIFPEYNQTSKKILDGGMNFIHGSSMYRKKAYIAAGGYGKREGVAEDQQLFTKILSAGWSAKKTENVYLEYRQHSQDQANMQFSYFTELKYLRDITRTQSQEKAELIKERQRADELYSYIVDSYAYRIGAIVIAPARFIKRLLTRR